MKVASRFMLPIEMFLGANLIALALTGGTQVLGGGSIYRALTASNETTAWLITLMSIGIPVFAVSAYEWVFMRDAPTADILRAVSARSVLSFLGTVTWIAALGFIANQRLVSVSMYLVMTAPLAAFFHGWAFVENLKVRYALSPQYPTNQSLTFHRFHR